MQAVSRLLDHFVPSRYQLHLDIEREKRVFHGTIDIEGKLVNTSIMLHAHELEIESVMVDGKAAAWQLGGNDELLITQDQLAPGNHIVTIGYSGVISDALHGLYPCHFTHDSAKKELLMTQCESHYAREVFPCIDEPAAKATFDVSVTTETGITVLGNMPTKSQVEEDGRLVTTFNTTPRMSTYLFALVMGELQSKKATTKDGVDVAVWATPAQQTSSLDYALDEAVAVIEFFNDYFGVPYPLPKADHVAVPDFSAGAMENWGLITYRESALIVDKQHSSLHARQYVSSVIAHELSHQWFGNLVTMKWWNNLWLNESFASIMEVIAPNALHPSWNAWLDFDTSAAVAALRRDAIGGVQSVQVEVRHPDEIQSIFDGAIVYAKGARLLRMMVSYIGEEAFRKGLKQYFSDHAYDNTDEHDLWKAVASASGKDVDLLMTTWISQPGYPVVTATLEANLLTLSQRQFLVGESVGTDKLWPIPLGATESDIPALLAEPSIQVPFTANLLYLNHDNSAHFITHYDDGLLARLLDQLRAGKLSTSQRLQLLNEQILLARGSITSPTRLIDTLEAYVNEDQDPVWDVMVMALGELRKYIEQDHDAEAALRQLTGRLATKQFKRLGWDPIKGESENDQKLRSRIIAQMIYSEDRKVIDEAIRRSRALPIEQLDPELRSLLLGADVRYGDNAQLVDDLLHRYKTEVSPDIKEDIRGALASTKAPKTISKLISILTDTSIIRSQDTTFWFIYLLSNRYARKPAWQWLRNQWPWVEKTFGTDKSYDYFPRYAGQLLMTHEQLDEYRAFFAPMRENIALKRVIDIGTADLAGRVKLIESNEQAVCERLKML